MTIFSALFMMWLSTSFFTPYIAIYVVDMLASFVNIKSNQLSSIFNTETQEITEPEHFFEYFVAYQDIVPGYMILGPCAILLSMGHIILSSIFFVPYYFIHNRNIKRIFYIEELANKF